MKRIPLPLPVLLILLTIAVVSQYYYPSERTKAWFPSLGSQVTAPETPPDASLMAAYIKHPQPKDISPFAFADGAGAPLDLAHWKGKVVLLNLWATWCGPCRKEMPELAKLQKLLGSADFEVVALSEDLKGAEASAAFLKESGSENLTLYIDPKASALAAVQSAGLPTTLLIDRNGKEIGRLLGPADWASAEAQNLVKGVLAQK
jgi:thiol-disulfide isomerase/thioredoxin